jgi:DNA-binding transcriptional regulator YiaG
MVMVTRELIIELRKAMRLTAAEFGARVDASENTVYQWESGRRHPSYRRQLKINALLDEAKKYGWIREEAEVA